ncbi:MAG: glycosyltransferase [bacterium]
MRLFDIIIPAFGNPEELQKCLQGFSQQTFSDFIILLCIDGTPEKINNYLMRNIFSLDIIPLHHSDVKRHGSNATRNLALPYLQSEYLLMFDSDSIPSADLVEQHYTLLTDHDCISLGGVKYLNSETHYLADYIQSRGKNKLGDGEIVPYKYFTSHNVAMKTRYFIQMQGQDDAIMSYGGDVEFSYRLKKNVSAPLIYNKKAISYSVWNKSTKVMLDQMEEFGSVTLPYLKQKHPELKKAFRVDLITKRGIQHLIIRIAVNNAVAEFFKKMLPYAPRFLKRMMIHYLLFQSIVQGFDSVNKDN